MSGNCPTPKHYPLNLFISINRDLSGRIHVLVLSCNENIPVLEALSAPVDGGDGDSFYSV